VTDKGMSAALYMALSRSLWRTFALDHPVDPELTMAETNRHILADTHGGLFITLFYGILNPHDGNFTYCSAGHHPALLIRAKDNSIEELAHTGIPLGVFEEASWIRAMQWYSIPMASQMLKTRQKNVSTLNGCGEQ